MSTPKFRYAVHADSEAVHLLIEAAYRSPATAGQWDSEAHLLTGPRTSVDEVAALIADRDGRFIIAEIDGKLAGCCLLQRRSGSKSKDGAEAAYFGMFAIDPAIRSVGLGKLILAEAERRVRQLWSSHAMVMTVISVRDQLIAWYERRGFHLTGHRIPFPFSETTGETTRDFDLVEMRKELV